jgi:hypothetical protein
MTTEPIIRKLFLETLESTGAAPVGQLGPDSVLLESGLDSLGFAILVSRLEEELRYDPFALMSEPYYPRTYGEFVGLYDRYHPHNAGN